MKKELFKTKLECANEAKAAGVAGCTGTLQSCGPIWTENFGGGYVYATSDGRTFAKSGILTTEAANSLLEG